MQYSLFIHCRVQNPSFFIDTCENTRCYCHMTLLPVKWLAPICVPWLNAGATGSNRKRSDFPSFPESPAGQKTTYLCKSKVWFKFHFEVGEAHRKALEMISIVGCSISLIAVLVTIAVSLMFWRAIKSPRAKVLLNLCIAIALSCIFVISEGFARDNKVFVYCWKRLLFILVFSIRQP